MLRVGSLYWGNCRTIYRKRLFRVGIEAGFDAVAWGTGISVAAAASRDFSGRSDQAALAAGIIVTVGALSLVCGLLAGLYQGRYQRGSLDEVFSLGITAALMTISLTALGGLLVTGQRAPLTTVIGGALSALLAMGGARYLMCAVRQLRRQRA